MSHSFHPEFSTMRFRPEEVAVSSSHPFLNDKLGREPFIRATTELIKSIKEPFVIALDAPWGSGKTTTLRMLQPHLEAEGVTAISFNAWEVDYATDPLVPLIATLHEALKNIKDQTIGLSAEKLERFKKVGGAIAKHALVAAAKIATVGVFDVSKAQQEVGDAINGAINDATGNITSDVIDAFKKEKDLAKEFKGLLEELVSLIRNSRQRDEKIDLEVHDSAENESPPLVLLIDELDRCRPTFAISMLERIKHFFQVPGIVFVLAMDLKQLQASTHKVYGVGLDAAQYLSRFIDLELRLPTVSMKVMVDSMLTSCGTDVFFKKRVATLAQINDKDQISETIDLLARHNHMSPRQVSRLISRLILVLRQTRSDEDLDAILVVFLLFLRLTNKELLANYFNRTARSTDVIESLDISSATGRKFYYSYHGQFIEAYLMFGHYDRGNNYVGGFLNTVRDAQMHDDTFTEEQQRDHDVYTILCNLIRDKRRLDLYKIERRINLFASDSLMFD